MFSTALLFLAAVSPVFAKPFITAPVGATVWSAGQKQVITWKDDGSAPSLADFGNSKVGIFVGNQKQQTPIQPLVESLNIANTTSIEFTPDATVGANGPVYFVRIESLALKDPASPQFPALAFSAKFTLNGMTGQFSPDVQAQIDAGAADNGSPAGTTPTTSTTVSTTTNGRSTTSNTGTGTGTGTRSGTNPTPSGNSTSGPTGNAGDGASSLSHSTFTCAAIIVAFFTAMLV